MQNEIPAGTKVGVLIVTKGETAVRTAEVLAHMNGVVHVNMDGEAISVDPWQIVASDAPAPAAPSSVDPGDAQLQKDLLDDVQLKIDALHDRVAALEADGRDIMAAIADLQTRMTNVESQFAPKVVMGASSAPLAVELPPAEQEISTTESTAAAESGEPAAGS